MESAEIRLRCRLKNVLFLKRFAFIDFLSLSKHGNREENTMSFSSGNKLFTIFGDALKVNGKSVDNQGIFT